MSLNGCNSKDEWETVRDSDRAFAVYEAILPTYPAELVRSIERNVICKDVRVPGSLLVISAGFCRDDCARAGAGKVLLGGLTTTLKEAGRRFGERTVAAFAPPESRVFVLHEKLGSGHSSVADTASHIGFRVFKAGRPVAIEDVICIGTGEMLSRLNWLENALPTTGSFAFICRGRSPFLDDLERAATAEADPYRVLAGFSAKCVSVPRQPLNVLATTRR